MHFFIETYKNNPDSFIFFDVFEPIYQKETSKSHSNPYMKHFRTSKFGSKDTVRFLSTNFHDGTVNPNVMVGFCKSRHELSKKYGVDCNILIENSCQLLLKGWFLTRQDNQPFSFNLLNSYHCRCLYPMSCPDGLQWPYKLHHR